MKNQLSANLVVLMDYHRIGGVQLARAINIPLSTIKNIRKGTNVNPTIETLIPLARYFDISLEEIINNNLSVEKLAANKNKISKTVSQAVPVISWEEVVGWTQHMQDDCQVFTEKQCSEQTFAVYLKQSVSEMFSAPGIVLIDPLQEPAHFDYVLVHKLGLTRPSIKQLVCDEDSHYLKSLVITSKLEPMDKNHKLLGVIIEYRQFFNKKIKPFTHQSSLYEEAEPIL